MDLKKLVTVRRGKTVRRTISGTKIKNSVLHIISLKCLLIFKEACGVGGCVYKSIT